MMDDVFNKHSGLPVGRYSYGYEDKSHAADSSSAVNNSTRKSIIYLLYVLAL